MKTSALLLLLLASVARADVITAWNDTALQAIRTEKTPPPQAARALAILHVAMWDAIAGTAQSQERFERYLVTGRPSGVAQPEAAAAAAAHFALARTFPAQQAAFDAVYQRALAALPNSAEKNAGVHWGEWVANIILGARANDGAGEEAPYTPQAVPGEWVPTPPQKAPPLLPQWPGVACFAVSHATQFRPVMPPVLSSAGYAFDFNLTKQIGGQASTARSQEQTHIAHFWADGPGTVTPPGHWNVIAHEVAAQRGHTLEQNARLFALLNIALADAAILCWDCKYFVKYWRPITAIREADTDGNPATDPDLAWEPLLTTPPFPEYTSGHSTFSSAAATVLAAFFGSDNVAFTASSEALQGFVRRYHSFSEAAAEAGMSRIYGGIHFMSANTQGQATGAKLGAYVMENLLKEKRLLAQLQPTPAATAPVVPDPARPTPPPGAPTSPILPPLVATAAPPTAPAPATPPAIPDPPRPTPPPGAPTSPILPPLVATAAPPTAPAPATPPAIPDPPRPTPPPGAPTSPILPPLVAPAASSTPLPPSNSILVPPRGALPPPRQ